MHKLNELLSIILKFFLIIAVCIGIAWAGISVWANIFPPPVPGELPAMPAMSKAQYVVLLKTTGEVMLTNFYSAGVSPKDKSLQLFTLKGFYRNTNNKWRLSKGTLLLDEYYFGDIEIVKRKE